LESPEGAEQPVCIALSGLNRDLEWNLRVPEPAAAPFQRWNANLDKTGLKRGPTY